MRSNIVIWIVAILLLAGCGTETNAPMVSGPATKVEEATQLPSPTAESSPSNSPELDFKDAEVTRVIDGDTVEIKIDGKKDTVRMLLVDTPETKDPNEPVQPFGPEASEFAKKTLEGKKVRIEYDGPERDKYKRLLAYIWIGDKTFNEMLLDEGYARVAYVYDPPYTHYEDFLESEKAAKAFSKGIWSIDGYATKDGFDVAAVASKESEPEPEAEQPVQEVFYKNCTAVRAAGAAPLYEGDPGYSTKLDRDRDGVACE